MNTFPHLTALGLVTWPAAPHKRIERDHRKRALEQHALRRLRLYGTRRRLWIVAPVSRLTGRYGNTTKGLK